MIKEKTMVNTGVNDFTFVVQLFSLTAIVYMYALYSCFELKLRSFSYGLID